MVRVLLSWPQSAKSQNDFFCHFQNFKRFTCAYVFLMNISAYTFHFGTIGSHSNEKCNTRVKQCKVNHKKALKSDWKIEKKSSSVTNSDEYCVPLKEYEKWNVKETRAQKRWTFLNEGKMNIFSQTQNKEWHRFPAMFYVVIHTVNDNAMILHNLGYILCSVLYLRNDREIFFYK